MADSEEQHRIKLDVAASPTALRLCVEFMFHAAVEAVRKGSPSLVMKGLHAYAVEGGQHDYRDLVSGLTLLYHGAILLGEDADELFAQAAGQMEGAARSGLISFLKRDVELRTLACMGYRTVTEPVFDFVDDLTIPDGVYTEETDLRLVQGRSSNL